MQIEKLGSAQSARRYGDHTAVLMSTVGHGPDGICRQVSEDMGRRRYEVILRLFPGLARRITQDSQMG